MFRNMLVAATLLFVLGCKQEKKTNEYIDSPVDSAIPMEAEIQIEEDTIAEDSLMAPLSYLKEHTGAYARQEHLFKQGVLAQRLQNLDKFNYEVLIQNYQTETPIVIINNIVHMSGCKQHDCPSNAYDFFIDIENDNINIYYFRSNMLRVYTEKGFIELPEEFSREMEIKKSNAGIGNTASIDSNYEL